MAKPQYTKPTSQTDLEERQKPDYVPSSQLIQGTDPDLSDNGYVGVDPIYQNYTNDTEKPYLAEKGPEKKVEELVYAEDVDTSKGATAEGEPDSEPEGEDTKTTPDGSTKQTTQAAGGSGGPATPTPPSS